MTAPTLQRLLALYLNFAFYAIPNVESATLSSCDGATKIFGEWQDSMSGAPNSKMGPGALLGNGYAGIVMGTGLFDATSVDYWLNTNAFWDCRPNPQNVTLPAAVCSRVALGGFSHSVQASSFAARQYISNGSLVTVQTVEGGVLTTTTIMHPTENIIVTEFAWSGDTMLAVNFTTWTYNSGDRNYTFGIKPISHASIYGYGIKGKVSHFVSRFATPPDLNPSSVVRSVRTSIAATGLPLWGNGTEVDVVSSTEKTIVGIQSTVEVAPRNKVFLNECVLVV